MAANQTQIDAALDRARRAREGGVTLHQLTAIDRKVEKSLSLFDPVEGTCADCGGKRPVHTAHCRLVR